MKKIVIVIVALFATNLIIAKSKSKKKNKETICTNECVAENQNSEMACKLTTPELRERKETVIKSLKSQIIERSELKNGFAFRFPGNDKMVDELVEFIKTERSCCDFFTFNLSISGDQSEAWLEISGKKGAKEIILSELEM